MLTAYWYSNSSDSYTLFGTNNSIDTNSGFVEMSQVNSNFSGYDTIYYSGIGNSAMVMVLSDEQNPLHVYVYYGNYTVTLKVTSDEGLTGNDATINTIS